MYSLPGPDTNLLGQMEAEKSLNTKDASDPEKL